MSEFKWSPQQADFLNWCQTGTGSCVLEAVAGAGKTTVLIAGVQLLRGSTALMAFNKKIANELKERLRSIGMDWKKAQAGTAHSFGLNAYRKAFPKFDVNGYKVIDLIEKAEGPLVIASDEDISNAAANIARLVSMAKQSGFGIDGFPHGTLNDWYRINDHHGIIDLDDPEMVERQIEVARIALDESNKVTDIIDFDDMIYLPLLKDVRFWQYDNVLMDEAQDTNPVRRELMRRMLKRNGRAIAVGDRHQAIYGFTGADANSLDLIKRQFAAIDLPLTVTYRCPKKVVEFSHQWVSHITAHESAPDGKVETIQMADFLKLGSLGPGSAVLSRVNAPLVSLAFKLIRNRVPCMVEGRDVGKSLVKLSQRWKVDTFDQLEERLEKHLEAETKKLLAKKQDHRAQVLEDTVETLRIIMEQLRSEGKYSIKDIAAYVSQLFGDDVTGMLVLSSIHKSKGREWPNVFWLDRANTCPSPWAKQAWQAEQEANLCYVAATRAQEALYDLIP